MNVDPVLALESLGYTQREAAFLYLVAVHSGYFLRRQFDYFIDRQKGAIAQHFLEKARVAGHIEIIDYGQGRHLYHLYAKPIYRLLGNAESQNRRRKGDGLIRARLITLDHVLENDGERYLETDAEKVRFFTECRGIPHGIFADVNGKLHPLLAASAISLANAKQPSCSKVQFLFADEALLTTEKFIRFLSVTESLLRTLGNFEVIYASNSPHNFAAAEKEFRNRFATRSVTAQGILGRNWREDSPVQHPPVKAEFTTVLFRYSYPNIRRNESSSLKAVRLSGLLQKPETAVGQPNSSLAGSNAG
jgi:hypothetical protein